MAQASRQQQQATGRAQLGGLSGKSPGRVAPTGRSWAHALEAPASTSWGTFPPQKYNADYDLSARQGADTLAFMSLLEEKLLPVLVSVPGPAEFMASEGGGPAPPHGPSGLQQHGDPKPTPSRARARAQTCLCLPASPIQIHTFWVDTKNYVEVTRKWYAEAMPFPLNFFLPGRMQRQHMERLQLLCGEHRPENEDELEKEVPLGPGCGARRLGPMARSRGAGWGRRRHGPAAAADLCPPCSCTRTPWNA